MGGDGSGRYPREKNDPKFVEGFLALDAQFLAQQGVLVHGKVCVVKWGDGRGCPRASVGIRRVVEGLEVRYTATDDQGPISICTQITIESTPCQYGGQRFWFKCPADQCGRRVRLLYGERDFLCRHCQQLTYRTQYQPRWKRLRQKVATIREKLGGSRNLFHPFPDRPKGMHGQTYLKLLRKEHAAAEACFRLMMKS